MVEQREVEQVEEYKEQMMPMTVIQPPTFRQNQSPAPVVVSGD